MKRIGNIIPRVAEYGNLTLAFWKAAKGKRLCREVRIFEANLTSHLAQLSQDVTSGMLIPGKFHRFVVCDSKRRIIHAASFRERVLHHAIMNIVGADFQRGAIEQSYACRKGKGNVAAVQRALHHTTTRSHYLKMDIRRFFDSIDHAILKDRFRRLFKDQRFLELLDCIVDSYQTKPGKGLPIGTLTSQYFANFYLDSMDHFIKEICKCRYYVRFMDDFVIWHGSPQQLQVWQNTIEGWLADYLMLRLKEGFRIGRTTDGLLFLGYRLKPGKILLGRIARRRFKRRLAEVEEAFLRGELSELELQRRVGSLLAFTDHAACRRWRSRILSVERFSV